MRCHALTPRNRGRYTLAHEVLMFPVGQMSGAENVHIVTTCEMSGSILCTTYAPIVGGIAAPNERITLPLVLSGSPLPKKEPRKAATQ